MALEILPTIPVENQKDYDTVIPALEIRYCSYYLKQVYQSQLKARLQGNSLQELGTDIEKLLRLAYPQTTEEYVHQIYVRS